eukprot:3293377-Alexandrium_andersonii.AAC.1
MPKSDRTELSRGGCSFRSAVRAEPSSGAENAALSATFAAVRGLGRRCSGRGVRGRGGPLGRMLSN